MPFNIGKRKVWNTYICWIPFDIGIQENYILDKAVNLALDKVNIFFIVKKKIRL